MNKAVSLPTLRWIQTCLVLIGLSYLVGCSKQELSKPIKSVEHTPWWVNVEPNLIIGETYYYAGSCFISKVKNSQGELTEVATFKVPKRFISYCENSKSNRNPLEFDGTYLIFTVCQMAFATGGCAQERYRTANFKTWQEYRGITWVQGEQQQVWRALSTTTTNAKQQKN